MSLRELQVWMKGIITDPRGSTDERLSVYAEAYFWRIVESMASDYSRLHVILGDEQFGKLIAEYLKEYPSRSPNLGEVGRHLPTFIQSYPSANDLPFLLELTKFEWALIETFFAPEQDWFDPSPLADLSEEAWSSLKVLISPSAKIFRSEWPLEKFWQLTKIEQLRSLQRSDSEPYLLWRLNHWPKLAKITEWEAVVLENLRAGRNLAATMDLVGEQFKMEAEEIFASFSRWLQDELIAGVIYEKRPL